MHLIHYNVCNFCPMTEKLKEPVARVVGILGMLLLGCGGCTVNAPLLTPSVSAIKDQANTEPLDHQLKISVRPVVTTGFRSEDRKQFGVDLSAYFTTFYIEVQNGLFRKVWIDPSQIYLQYNDLQPVQALSESESIEYYRHREQPQPVLTLIPKSRKVEKQEITKIRELSLHSATLPPAGRVAGVIYFNKIPDRHCEEVLLKITGIQIEGEDSSQGVQFSFSCAQ